MTTVSALRTLSLPVFLTLRAAVFQGIKLPLAAAVLLSFSLTLSEANAQTTYLAQEIIPAGAVGGMSLASLNNQGEVALAYAGSVQLWLPAARLGLPVGSTEIYGGPAPGLPRLTDGGRLLFKGTPFYWDGLAIRQAPVPPDMEAVALAGLNDSGAAVGTAGREPRVIIENGFPRDENPWEYQYPVLIQNNGAFTDLRTVFPTTPADRERLYTPRNLNGNGDIVGWVTDYVKILNPQGQHVAWAPPRIRTFIRRDQVFSIIPAADDTNAAFVPYDLNEKGQILIERIGITTISQLYLYLPVVDYGFPQPGLRGPIAEHSYALPQLNDEGQVAGFIWTTSGGIAPEIWNRATWLDVRTLPIVQTGFVALRAWDINNRGQILCTGTVPGKAGEHPFLLTQSAGLFATFLFPTNRLSVGEEMEFVVRVTNGRVEPLHNVQIVDLQKYSGTGDMKELSGPTPGTPVDLQFREYAEHRYRYRATTNGTFAFGVDLQAQRTNNAVITNRSVSQPIQIVIHGDLLLKRAVLSDAFFSLNDIYQRTPSGAQIQTNSAGGGEVAEFQVRLQNDDPQPRVFSLTAVEPSDAGWQVSYLSGGADISAALRSPAGRPFAELPPNQFHTVTVRVSPTNATPGSAFRIKLALSSPLSPNETLDIVETVTERAFEIIVNSTGDLPDKDPDDCCCDTGNVIAGGAAECTLRAALEVANKHPGKDIIRFEIPDSDSGIVAGVPRIEPKTPLPAITGPIVLDGWSQQTNSATPPIEIAGDTLAAKPGPFGDDYPSLNVADQMLVAEGASSGLVANAPECEFRGLAINHFLLAGLELNAPNNVVQGVFFGTDPTGQIPRANGTLHPGRKFWGALRGGGLAIRSAGNLIGGPGRSRNVFSGTGSAWRSSTSQGTRDLRSAGVDGGWTAPGIIIQGPLATGNRIEGNVFGLDPSGMEAVVPSGSLQPESELKPYAGVLINRAPGNTIGGTSSDTRNLFAGQSIGVLITGAGAVDNRVVGNVFGLNQQLESPVAIGRRFDNGVSIRGGAGRNFVGGSNPGEANLITARGDFGIEVSDSSGVIIQSNDISSASHGIHLSSASGAVVEGNTVQNCFQAGIWVEGDSDLLIQRNRFSGTPSEAGIFVFFSTGNLRVFENDIFRNRRGVLIYGAVGSQFIGNRIHDNTEDGVHLRDGAVKNQILQNQIRNNQGLGISFGDGLAPTPNNLTDGIQNYPELNQVTAANNTIRVDARLISAPGVTCRVEFFANGFAHRSGYGEGERFLGVMEVTPGLLGVADFVFTNTAPVVVGEYITATATDAAGNTSEFSKWMLVCSAGDADRDGICDELEERVPGRGGGSPRPPPSGRVRIASADGDGNGDGIADSGQANVCSLIGVAGKWITLAAGNGITFNSVAAGGPPEFASLPPGYSFPVGFVSFSVTGFVAGAIVSVTNIFHGDFDYTTVFAYGPTPDNPQPHWYEFAFDGSTGATLGTNQFVLTFRDGHRGDHDLQTNGNITTILAPACLVPPGPTLRLLSHSISLVATEVFTQESTNAPVLTTNQVPLMTSVLAWPVTATNHFLEFNDGLSPTNFWRPVLDEPAFVGDQLVVTNYSYDPVRFYRLYQFEYAGVPSAVPVLNIARTSTNTFLLSWPSSTTGFVLQGNSDAAATNWGSTTNPVIVVNGQNQVIVPPVAGAQFYRLKSP